MWRRLNCCQNRRIRRLHFLPTILLSTIITYATYTWLTLPLIDEESHICKLIVKSSNIKEYAAYISNSTTTAGVPMILHFVYKDAIVLEAYRSSLETCIRLNSNWTVMLWTDDSVERFISREYPQYRFVFYQFPHKLQRADAIRYLLLYRFGGVYLDLDMICHQPLIASLSNIPCFLDKERLHQSRILHGSPYTIMNSAMGCRPSHPFFKKLLDSVFHVNQLKRRFIFPETIMLTTGPGILKRVYEQWQSAGTQPPVTLLSESYFSPYMNPQDILPTRCRRILKSMSPNKLNKTLRESACLDLQKLGYEKSDAIFLTNQTVAIHQFTHLGYHRQHLKVFLALKQFPSILTYTNICLVN